MPSPVLDAEQMQRLRDLQKLQSKDVRIFEELSAIFARDSRSYLQGLQQAIDAADEAESRKLLHALKGAALSVGAAQVVECCRRLEQAAAGPSLDAVRQLETLAQTAQEALKASQTN